MYSYTPKQPMEYNPNISRSEADFDNEMTGDWDTEADVAQVRDVEMIAPESNMSAGWTQLDMFQKHREKYNTGNILNKYTATNPSPSSHKINTVL